MNNRTHTVDLAEEEISLLPEREALSYVNLANVVADNTALALNAGSLRSTASAVADQSISVYQR